MSDRTSCILYRAGGSETAKLSCGGKLPRVICGCMDRDQLRELFRFCPQCGRPIIVSDKAKPASPATERKP